MAFQVKDQDLYIDQDLYGSRVPTATEMRVISLVADGMRNHEVANVIATTDIEIDHTRSSFEVWGGVLASPLRVL